jgi:hypothetical protein
MSSPTIASTFWPAGTFVALGVAFVVAAMVFAAVAQ